MKLNREYIVAIAVLLVIVTILGGAYQFYYKQRLEQYADDAKRLASLEKALTTMETTFSGYEPSAVIKAETDGVEPVTSELARRATLFTLGDLLDVEEKPEGKMVRFYYEEQFKKLFDDLRQRVATHVPQCYYDVDGDTFDAPRPEDARVQALTEGDEAQAQYWLRRIRMGAWAVRTLMDAKAIWVYKVDVWPPRKEYNILIMRTVGLHFLMMPADLVKFLDDLRLKDQYYTVDALSIQNRYLRWQPEPPVEVRMLLTRAAFVPPSAAPARPGAPTPAAAPAPENNNVAAKMLASQNLNARRPQTQQGPTTWQRFKRFMRQYIPI